MAREQKTVALKRPFENGKGGVVREVIVQEPSAGDYFSLGNPQVWLRSNGSAALVDNDATVKAYIERLIVEPDPLLAMRQMSLLDAIAVKDAVMGFFIERPPEKTEKTAGTKSD